MRSHRGFQSEFCSPEEPHEKGGIEGEAGYFRRNHWVPMPKARDLADLNAQLLAACRQKQRVRFATAAALINELVEAKHQLQLGRALARWARYDLIALDEVGYVPLAEVGESRGDRHH